MSLSASRLAGVIAPDLENRMRTDLLAGSIVSYPNLTKFCADIANSIANAVVAEVTANAQIIFSGAAVGAGSFNIPGTGGTSTPVTGSGSFSGTAGVS
jgi:hypothetical protein